MGGFRIPGPTRIEDAGGDAIPRDTGSRPVGKNTGRSAGPRLDGWPRSIAWSEFSEVASRPAGVNEAAQIHTEVVQPDQVGVQRENGRLRLGGYVVRVQVVSADTWVVTGQKTNELLAHEQGHFDITGLSGRDMVRDLGAIRAADTDELQREVHRIIAHYGQLSSTLSSQYDTETRNGADRAQQQRWEAHLRSCSQNGSPLSAPPTP